MRIYLRRKISAAHFLPGHPGPCRNMHGHTWRIELWLEGRPDPATGMLADFRVLKSHIDLLDHRVLNDVLPEKYQPPTAENLALFFLENISEFCVKARVWESDDAYAEVFSFRRILGP